MIIEDEFSETDTSDIDNIAPGRPVRAVNDDASSASASSPLLQRYLLSPAPVPDECKADICRNRAAATAVSVVSLVKVSTAGCRHLGELPMQLGAVCSVQRPDQLERPRCSSCSAKRCAVR